MSSGLAAPSTGSVGRPAILGGRRSLSPLHRTAFLWPRPSLRNVASVTPELLRRRTGTLRQQRALEREFASWLGSRYALTQCNGTSGLVAALHGVGVSPGDEVIVQSITFWGSATAILHCGAVPVFADMDPSTLGLDPVDVERRITDRTRAILVVHLTGIPSLMTPILALARKYGLSVVEDASHAHGARYGTRRVGTLGDVGLFSLHSSKLCPAGEGGVLVTDDEDVWARAAALGQYERIPELPSRHREYPSSLGWNFRMSSLNAAVARAQLRQLDARNRYRSESMGEVSAALRDLGFDVFDEPEREIERVYHLFCLRHDAVRTGVDRESFARALTAEGLPARTSVGWMLHREPLFTTGRWREVARLPASPEQPKFARCELPVTEALAREVVFLPVLHGRAPGVRRRYVRALRKVTRHSGEVSRRCSTTR